MCGGISEKMGWEIGGLKGLGFRVLRVSQNEGYLWGYGGCIGTFRVLGFPKLGVPFFGGVPIIRIIVVGVCLYWDREATV